MIRKALGDLMKLRWTLAECRKYGRQPIPVSGEIDLSAELKARHPEILDVSPVSVEGIILPESDVQILVSLQLRLTMTLPSSRSLKPAKLPLDIQMTEIYLAPDAPKHEGEEDLVFRLEKDWFDLSKPIEDTILISIPMQILTEDEKAGDVALPSGQDWAMMTEEKYQAQKNQTSTEQTNNSPFSVLKDLFLENEAEGE